LLSDHVISLFGRTITITKQEQLFLILVLAAVALVWAVQLFRRKRSVIVQRSVVSDQMLYELARIADALDRIANHPADQVIATANRRAEESRVGPLSILGRDRPRDS
jgi:hypothetical protein